MVGCKCQRKMEFLVSIDFELYWPVQVKKLVNMS